MVAGALFAAAVLPAPPAMADPATAAAAAASAVSAAASASAAHTATTAAAATAAATAAAAVAAAAASSAAGHHLPAAPPTSADVLANAPLALLLSTVAGLSTGLGGIVITRYPDLGWRRLGHWQAAAAGFMLTVSALDLLPGALADAPPQTVAVAVAVGAALVAAIKAWVPDPDVSALVGGVENGSAKTVASPRGGAGGSGGSAAGGGGAAAADRRRRVLTSALVTAVGLTLHNAAEGAAVCLASLKGLRFGLPITLAILAHNIPEGLAVALPVFFATRSARTAIALSFASGLAEPAGVLILLVAVHFVSPSTAGMGALLAGVAGIMAAISVLELLPQAVSHAGRVEAAVSAIAGGFIMAAVLSAIHAAGIGV